MRLIACFLLLSAFATVSPAALAQKPRSYEPTRPAQPVQQEERQDETADELAPGLAEELDLERTLPFLAYTLGELHYLAYACEGLDAQQWRDRMVEFLAMEAAEDNRLRNRLINSFNQGYRSQQRYRARCGPEADAERRALAHRGRDLAEMLRSAYFD